MGFPKESQTPSQRPLLLVPRSEKVGRVGEDPGNEVVGKQNWLHLFNKYSYYYNVINILNATFFSADYNCICREIAACLSAYWMSKRCFCILYHLLSKLFSLFTSIDRDKDANGEKINENLCTNRSEKTLIVHWERNTPTENRLTIAEHSILWFKRRKKAYSIGNYEEGKPIF